jgi:RNA polymerase sigma-70 factor (ECF subfamily)
MRPRTDTLVRVDQERSDAAVVAAIAAGDRRALETLYHRHARMLTVRLHRRCGDPELVDSAMQDTFLAVWRSAGTYRDTGGEVGAWLWTIALRKLIDQMRRRPAPSPSATLPEPEPLPAPGTRAHDLLGGLPAELHDVVRAVYLDGLTTSEAAVLLGIPQGTVKSRLARARSVLQEDLR